MIKYGDEFDISEVLKGINIPTPPQIVADLQLELSTPEPDLNNMSEMISSDVGLSGAILKIVNSPFYSGRGTISSISQAVMHLGIKVVVEIVNAHCLREACTPETMPKSTYSALIRFWDSAADVAKVAAMVARMINVSPKINVYTLGLFHNVGIALLAAKYEDYFAVMRDSYNQEALSITDYEANEFNTHHAVVGYYVARAWKLDKSLCDLIDKHHRMESILEISNHHSEDALLLGVLKIAEHITGLHRILGNTEEDHEWNNISHKVFEITGMSQYEYEEIVLQAKDNGIGSQSYFN